MLSLLHNGSVPSLLFMSSIDASLSSAPSGSLHKTLLDFVPFALVSSSIQNLSSLKSESYLTVPGSAIWSSAKHNEWF